VRIAIALAAAALIAACSSSPSSPAPHGWQPIAGTTNAWSTGRGADHQEYYYVTSPFNGTLSDLASRVTVDALLRYRGARLRGSVPFQPCPGAAGVATFQLVSGATLQEGFAVRNGQAIQVRYLRPTGSEVDPNVAPAMHAALCTL
jgi:hypothetical protein